MSNRMKSLKLIVFDLDYTLWPFWVDTHVTPPFQKRNHNVYDKNNKKIQYYPDAIKILEKLHKEGYILAIASRTGEIDGANKLLELFDWDKFFSYKEIYPGCKVTHFQNFKKKSGIDYSNMLFFDDEERNIVDLSKQGVKSILVNNGVTLKLIEDSISNFMSN